MANLKSAKQWFKIAIRDLRDCEALIALGPNHKHSAAYHAQQCAEKAIKGFLTYSEFRVPKTHDLGALAKLVSSVEPELSKLILRHKSLTNLAIAYRYPDAESKPLTFATTKSAAKKARQIYDQCLKLSFGKAGH